MTKREILIENGCHDMYGGYEDSMDQYAKQQAIEFAQWVLNGNWLSNEETYNLFLKQKES